MIRKRLFVTAMMLILFITPAQAAPSGYLDSESGRTMVPLRFISENFGVPVQWNGTTRQITINEAITLQIGKRDAHLGTSRLVLDQPPVLKQGVTHVPIRFIGEALGADVNWEKETSTVHIHYADETLAVPVKRTRHLPTTVETRTFNVNDRTIRANVITFDPYHDVTFKTALAKDRVGAVDSLRSIAEEHGASLAVNGTFFDAYTAVKEPYGLIVADGEPVHIGRGKAVFWFDQQQKPHIDVLSANITGTNGDEDNWRGSWYAYWLNRTPSENGDSGIIFTPARGSHVGFNYGKNIIVEKDIVTAIQQGNVAIPKDGYVINFTGAMASSLVPRFTVGEKTSYTITLENEKGHTIENETMMGAIGAGPRLVKNGKIAIEAKKEGFTEAKILTQAAARSAIGITEDDRVIVMTTRGATIQQLASMMTQAGAVEAMNLDGGASSGLYYDGNYITQPGRSISNALLVIPN